MLITRNVGGSTEKFSFFRNFCKNVKVGKVKRIADFVEEGSAQEIKKNAAKRKLAAFKTLATRSARSRASGARAARSRRRSDMSRRRRGRRNETRSRRIIISRRRSDVTRRRGRREVISRRRRGRRDINRAGIGRVKEGTAAEVQGNAEIGGFRLDRNAQRSDRDGADEERSSERASETAFDGSFHRGNPRKVGKRSNDRFERAKWKIDASAATANVANALFSCTRRFSISTRKRRKKLPVFPILREIFPCDDEN